MSKIDTKIFNLLEEKWVWRRDDTNLKTFHGLSEEKELLDKIKPYLTNNKVMVQAGGNCGMQIVKFAEYFDFVYTFEPDPINFYCLVNNLPYDNVIKFQACLGEHHELVSLETLEGEIGGFFVNKSNGFIPTLKIDDLRLNDCSFIQLDVEGYQLYGLRGAYNTIKNFKPVISVEMDWVERYNIEREDIVKFLVDLNYKHVETYTSDHIYIYKQ